MNGNPHSWSPLDLKVLLHSNVFFFPFLLCQMIFHRFTVCLSTSKGIFFHREVEKHTTFCKTLLSDKTLFTFFFPTIKMSFDLNV